SEETGDERVKRFFVIVKLDYVGHLPGCKKILQQALARTLPDDYRFAVTDDLSLSANRPPAGSSKSNLPVAAAAPIPTPAPMAAPFAVELRLPPIACPATAPRIAAPAMYFALCFACAF